ncbi:MAG: hypothetical protein Q9N34_02050 [Aquificota bacterium]|nr:hypothetical protein [Aquificota bacterium]
MREILRKVWQFLSFIFVLYGFYLLFLFLWDAPSTRVKEELALSSTSTSSTLLAMGTSAVLWIRKHRENIPLRKPPLQGWKP